ncbi:unnamed protein product [Paramecium sonneborni]|uniref:Uncharacterized protein n=1 Tax=Paramecium sonneborni TaxID=65129 RepID=A0A8S1MZJ1_9CILI|nr:unnamed protein product [Paramecium sonneborni]
MISLTHIQEKNLKQKASRQFFQQSIRAILKMDAIKFIKQLKRFKLLYITKIFQALKKVYLYLYQNEKQDVIRCCVFKFLEQCKAFIKNQVLKVLMNLIAKWVQSSKLKVEMLDFIYQQRYLIQKINIIQFKLQYCFQKLLI